MNTLLLTREFVKSKTSKSHQNRFSKLKMFFLSENYFVTWDSMKVFYS